MLSASPWAPTGNFLSIADFATVPWIVGASIFYGADEAFEFDKFPKVKEWVDRVSSLPSFQKAKDVTPFPKSD